MKSVFRYFGLVLALPAAAQPVITVDDLTETIGAQVPLYVGNFYAPGPATNNFNVNRTNAILGEGVGSLVLDPDLTPYGSSYPQANIASFAVDDTTAFTYGLLNANGYYSYGRYSPVEHVILNNPELQFRLPMNLGDTWSDQWSGAGTNGGQNYSRSGTTTGVYNGHGTVNTPFGSFPNAARIEVEQNYFDITAGVEVNYQTSNVYYYISGFNRPVFSSSRAFVDLGAGPQLVLSFSTFADPAVVGIAEQDGDLPVRLFPNPAEDHVTVQWEATAGTTFQLELLDATGRHIRPIPVTTGLGTTTLTVPVADLPAGAYLLRIADGVRAQRILPLMVQ